VDLVEDLVGCVRVVSVDDLGDDEVGVHEAKTNLSALLRRVGAGEVITIKSGGRPVARLMPVRQGGERVFGQDRGAFSLPDDFDAPLPDDVLRDFE
jgi:prevent-host-death family protein